MLWFLHDRPERSAQQTRAVLSNDIVNHGGGAVVSLTDPGHGRATTDGTTLTYSPADGFVGDDTFTYTLTDSIGQVDLTTVTVHVGNRPPIAVPDAMDAPTAAPATLDALTDDSDPDGDELGIYRHPAAV
jgi:hypothetical protein